MTITRTASLLALLLAALPAWAVEPFTAEYEASWKGVQADARMTLSPAGDNRWRYELNIANQLGSARQATVFEDHDRSEEHTSELQSRENLVCRLLLEKKKNN